ncbi:MAG: hypothetical protein EOM53_02550 [Alphaproteobacteria bacterium]|nr:hypothetical protein [Alphaproteobacteria bacterium]NCB49545.1 hypothetical protein [Alphaproteobacteria bacterium]
MIKGLFNFLKSGVILRPYSIVGILFGIFILNIPSQQDNFFSNAIIPGFYVLLFVLFGWMRLIFWMVFQRMDHAYIKDSFFWVLRSFFLSVIVFWCFLSFILTISL